ncbi:MAG: hypothetical protein RBS43_00725 [Candidatus Cloacimonas sp.]|jgi:phage-related protein|nr:hypothetical protein [Candidatus Cloacimonas sp.]
MIVVYYPGKADGAPNSLSKFVAEDLLKLNFKQWKKLDFFLRETELGTNDDLVEQIVAEQKKPWEKRKLASLGDGLHEYRGSASQKGTVRMYFYYTEDMFVVLDAEYKTSDKNVVERARTRMREMIAKVKGAIK